MSFPGQTLACLGHVSIPEQISVTEVGARRRVCSANTTHVVRGEVARGNRVSSTSTRVKPQGCESLHEKEILLLEEAVGMLLHGLK